MSIKVSNEYNSLTSKHKNTLDWLTVKINQPIIHVVSNYSWIPKTMLYVTIVEFLKPSGLQQFFCRLCKNIMNFLMPCLCKYNKV